MVSVGTMDTLRTSGQGGWLGPGAQSHVMACHHVPPGAVLMCNRTVCSFRSKRPPYPLLRGPDPVCLHHLSSCAEPVNHTAGGQGPSQGTVGLGAALGFLIDTSTFPLPAPCPQPLTELWTVTPPPPPNSLGHRPAFIFCKRSLEQSWRQTDPEHEVQGAGRCLQPMEQRTVPGGPSLLQRGVLRWLLEGGRGKAAPVHPAGCKPGPPAPALTGSKTDGSGCVLRCSRHTWPPADGDERGEPWASSSTGLHGGAWHAWEHRRA